MATWSGWQVQFLQAAHILDTPPNRSFLTEWASRANSPSCRRNPIDLHDPVGGSTNCVRPAGFTWWTQNYTTHDHAAAAFAAQVNSRTFGAILDTLGSGNPFQDPGHKLVAEALRKWGSTNFADWYEAQFGGGGGGGGGGGKQADLLGGWHSLRRSLNRNWRHGLSKGERDLHAALRALSHSRKVRL